LLVNALDLAMAAPSDNSETAAHSAQPGFARPTAAAPILNPGVITGPTRHAEIA
jgi:hypothetical protein